MLTSWVVGIAYQDRFDLHTTPSCRFELCLESLDESRTELICVPGRDILQVNPAITSAVCRSRPQAMEHESGLPCPCGEVS